MTTNETLIAWLAATTDGASANALSLFAGVPQATLNRQMKTGELSPENVVKIARAYGVSVLDALVAQGLISPTDIETTSALDALANATDAQLVNEIGRRLDVADASGVETVFDDPAPVIEFPERSTRPYAAHGPDQGGEINPEME